MQFIRGFNQVVYFILELTMFGSLAYAGYHSVRHPYGKYLLGIGLPLLAIVLWGFLAAPRSAYRLALPYRSIFALTLFGLSAFLLYRTGQPRLALIFGIIALGSELTALLLKQ